MTQCPPVQEVDLFQWRQAIASADGPKHAQTRHVLLTLSLHMNRDGENAWPSQATLATRTGLNERVVRRHLAYADKDGWLHREEHRRASGQNWKYTIYRAVVPIKVHESMPEHPWDADPTWTR